MFLLNQEIKVHQTLIADYRYADVNFDKESENTTLKWLRGNLPIGTFEVILEANSKTYLIREEDAGKYLKFEITPVAQSGVQNGRRYTSPVVGPVKSLFGLALTQSKIKIVEIGNKYRDIVANDYIILHNSSNTLVSLDGFVFRSR